MASNTSSMADVKIDRNGFVAYPIRFRIEIVACLVLYAAIALTSLIFAFWLAGMVWVSDVPYKHLFSALFLVVFAAMGALLYPVFHASVGPMRRWLNYYRYTDSTLEEYDPILRKHSSVLLDDVVLVIGFVPRGSSSVTRSQCDSLLLTSDGQETWVMDTHPIWPEINSRLAGVPRSFIPRDWWNARSNRQTNVVSLPLSRPLEDRPVIEPTTYHVTNEERLPFVLFFVGLIGFFIFELVTGQGGWMEITATTALLLLLFGVALYFQINSRNNRITLHQIGLTAILAGTAPVEMTWNEITSVVLLERRMSFRRRSVISVIVTDIDGKHVVIPGVTQDVDEMVAQLSHHIPTKISRV